MRVWVLGWLVACGATEPEPSAPEPAADVLLGEPAEGVPQRQLGADGPMLTARKGAKLFNSKPDHPVTRVNHRRYEGRELFVDGEPLGPLPVTSPIRVGDRTFEILVGPGDRIPFQKRVVAKPGILILELGD